MSNIPLAARLRLAAAVAAIVAWQTAGMAQTSVDGIVLSDAADLYWPKTAADGTMTFKNKQQMTFTAERMGGQVQAATFYGGGIALDASSAGLGNTAAYKSITPDGVFASDAKVCYYTLNLARKGKSATARFERTFADSRLLDCIFLGDAHLARHKTVELTLPAGYHVLERNLDSHIAKRQYQNKRGETVHSYTITDLPPTLSEPMAPSRMKSEPLLQGVLSCSFAREEGCVVFRKVMEIRNRLIPRADFALWNDALRRWNDAANEQVVLEY